MGFHFRLVLMHRFRLQGQPERLARRELEEGVDQLRREQPSALGSQPVPDLFGVREGGLIGMQRRGQNVDTVGEENQVGEARDVRGQRLLFEPRPATVVITDDRRQVRQRREIAQQFFTAQAVLLRPLPLQFGDQAPMDAGRRNAAVVQQAGVVKQQLRLLIPPQPAGQFACQHADPAAMQQVVDPDEIDGVGDRHHQLAQVNRQGWRQVTFVHRFIRRYGARQDIRGTAFRSTG
ncbi:MAG: hypothetical protein WCB88_08195 [Azonexus sp.]